jgi:WD40 repeat protein
VDKAFFQRIHQNAAKSGRYLLGYNPMNNKRLFTILSMYLYGLLLSVAVHAVESLPPLVPEGEIVENVEKLIKQTTYHNSVYAVAFSPDGTILASSGLYETVRLWNVRTGTEIRRLEGHSRLVPSVAFSPDENILASGSFDKTIRLWDIDTGTELKRLDGHSNYVESVAFSPNGDIIASGSWDKTVRLWDVNTGTELKRFDGHFRRLFSVAFSPDGHTIASGSKDKTVRLWDVNTGTELKRLDGHSGFVESVAFSPDGHTIASGSSDKTIRLWDVDTGTELERFEGHSSWVRSVAFSPDGHTIASGSNDNTVRLWDINIGTELKRLDGHSQGVWSVAFSPDGYTLASGSSDGTVRLWDVQNGQLQQRLVSWKDGTWLSCDGRNRCLRSSLVNKPNNMIPKVLPKSLRLSMWYQYILLLALTIIVLSMVLYYLYHHHIVEGLSTNASGLLRLPLPMLPKVRRLLRLTRRLDSVLSDSTVSVRLLNKAIGFLKMSPVEQATILANRLGAKCEEMSSNLPLKKTDLFRLHLHESFPLNLKSFLLYLPATRLSTTEILNQLQQREEMALQKVVIILLNTEQWQALHAYGRDISNLWIVPNHSELTEWLLSPNPVQIFGWILAAQIKITQISPYQTRTGVNRDAVFFGRTQILDHILNRTPANYLVIGGRQLGKSSLLKHIHRHYHNDLVVQCHYLPLQGDNLQGQLATEFGLPSNSDLDSVLTQLAKIAPGQRRLLLIDEADLFIRAEIERDYPILRRFRAVSEKGYCHFILAGFWELHQASVLDYQSPLKNFGEPINIAELEIDACRDLATKPMKTMNLQYSSEALINDLLTKTGQRANLIATLCNEMLKELSSHQRVLGETEMVRAFNSKAMHDALKGWQAPSNDNAQLDNGQANRLDRMIVYMTIKQGEFKWVELRQLLKKLGCTYTPKQVEQSLERLELSFVIKRESQGRYVYCVPLFREMLLEDDVDELLQWELDS